MCMLVAVILTNYLFNSRINASVSVKKPSLPTLSLDVSTVSGWFQKAISNYIHKKSTKK